MSRKIVLISSGQPSANPRMVKEAIALAADGYKIKVIYCPLSPWADAFDEQLFQAHPQINWIQAGYHPLRQKALYVYARLRQKFYKGLYKLFGDVNDAAIRSMVLYSQELVAEAKKHEADLFIGHNPGALPAVIKAAKKYHAKAGFDFEDFHKGEDTEGSLHWIKIKQTEERYIPLLNFATAASPLIATAYQSLFTALAVTAVNNCFPLSYVTQKQNLLPVKPLKLFWFSQYIGLKRGLETVLEAMGKMKKGDVELTLLGNCSAELKNYFHSCAVKNGVDISQVKFPGTVAENEITMIAASHHIGLACEVAHTVNRDICLTNKIFMYLLAGNAIAFSNTKAQEFFLSQYPGIGVMYQQNNAEQLASLFQQYIDEAALLQQHQQAAGQLATAVLHWEKEKQVLLQQVKEVLQ